MAKGKSSSGGARNDGRANGKAAKQNPGRKTHGSKSSKPTELEKILMGKGLAVTYARNNANGARSSAGKRNKKDD